MKLRYPCGIPLTPQTSTVIIMHTKQSACLYKLGAQRVPYSLSYLTMLSYTLLVGSHKVVTFLCSKPGEPWSSLQYFMVNPNHFPHKPWLIMTEGFLIFTNFYLTGTNILHTSSYTFFKKSHKVTSLRYPLNFFVTFSKFIPEYLILFYSIYAKIKGAKYGWGRGLGLIIWYIPWECSFYIKKR